MEHRAKRSAMWSTSLVIGLTLLAVTAMTRLLYGQGAGATQGTPQTPQGPQGGRGGRGGDPAAQGRGGGGQRRGGFPQFTRQLAPQDVLVRGKGLYEANCASCHATDIRGSATGPNLMRSGIALRDQHGELVGEAVSKHTPALTLIEGDVVSITEYIHSIQATAGGQGSPPGRNPQGLELNVLVGDAKAGETYFNSVCSNCHSVGGDLMGIGSKFSDARSLQNAWVAGTGGGAGGPGGGGGRGARGERIATVTMADGSTLVGTLVRKDDFLVILMLEDGTRKSMARDPNTGIPKVDVKDRNEAHKEMVLSLDDPQNKKMHDVTAYLWTIK